MNMNDARVVATRSALISSFFKLLPEKSVGRMTVKELCEMSGINRSTFYKHFRDPLDILEQLEEELLASLEAQISPDITQSAYDFHLGILTELEKNGERLLLLTSKNADPGLSARAFELGYRRYVPRFEESYPDLTEEQREMLYSYLSSGSGGVLMSWLISGRRESAERVAAMLTKMNNAAVKPFCALERGKDNE